MNNEHGFVRLALNVANKIRRDWYAAMLNNAEEEVFDQLRRDIKGDTFAAWCELINLHFASQHNTICASPMTLLKILENDKANGTVRLIPDMEENDDDILEDIK